MERTSYVPRGTIRYVLREPSNKPSVALSLLLRLVIHSLALFIS